MAYAKGITLHSLSENNLSLENITENTLRERQKKKFLQKYESNREDILRKIKNSLREKEPIIPTRDKLHQVLAQDKPGVISAHTNDNSFYEQVNALFETY
ncbi:Plasmodium exported portein, unknown function, partial [Plasmodium malariae]